MVKTLNSSIDRIYQIVLSDIHSLVASALMKIMKLTPVDYKDLNSRQKENYNYHKFSAVLADFGFTTIRLSDDWEGADMIAQDKNGEVLLKIQLKSRLTFSDKYSGERKNIWICFRDRDDWYLYPHDILLEAILKETNVKNTKSWIGRREYIYPSISKKIQKLIDEYKIPKIKK